MTVTTVPLPNKPVFLESEWNLGHLKNKAEVVIFKINGEVHSVFRQRLRRHEHALSQC